MPHADALHRLHTWPRQRFANLPTPLLPAPNLRVAIGAGSPEILIKMDAETGCALGGNKVRKLEFELAPRRLDGVTCLITAGGPQSNHCRVTAGVAARLGLDCVLVLNGVPPEEPRGNAYLHRLFGARIRTVGTREDRDPTMRAVAEEVAAGGGRALVVPLGASTAVGTLGYAAAFVELADELDSLPKTERTWIFTSASSCGTIAGLLLGASLLERDDVRFVAVSADVSAFELRSEAVRLAREGAQLLGFTGPVLEAGLAAADEFVGRGYGVPTPASEEALRLFAQTEGVVLDPVYSAKAAAGMTAWLRNGSAHPTDRVIFLHTGGHPALFA